MPYELLEESPQQVPESTRQIPESSLGFIGRTGARTLARAGEAVVGLPGDIASAGLGLANYGISKITGKPGPIPKIPLPTSQAIRENVTKPLTGDYLEPQGSGEKFYDDIIGDAALLFAPFKGKVPFAKAATGALARSAIGNTAQWAAEEVTGSPIIGAGVKIGSMALAGTFGGRKQLNTLKQESYNKAFSNLKPNYRFNISPERTEIDKLIRSISRGDRPDKSFILDRLRSLDNVNGSNLEEVINIKQDWNKYLSDPSLGKASRDTLKKAVGTLNNGIKRYGSTNPEFYKPYKIGEELTGALQSTNYVQQILSKHPYLEKSIKNPLAKHLLFGSFLYGSGKIGAPTIAAGIGTAAALKEGAKAYQLLTKSPVARKIYKDTIEATLKNDVKSIAKNLSKLDKVADNFSKDNPEVQQESNKKGRYELLN